jgi:hypothetical protein
MFKLGRFVTVIKSFSAPKWSNLKQEFNKKMKSIASTCTG